MKTLDVDAFHENIQAILDSIKSQKEQIQGLISQVQAFSSLDDAFKGKGGEAIRSFYETGHASFLTLYHSLLTSYEARLTQITHALRSFEPSEDGYITQPFLQDTIPAHLNQTRNTTVSLVDQANAAIQKVSHLASVSALNDQGFLTEVEQAKNKADKTMNDLVRFDEQQTQSLSAIQDQLTSLNSLLSKVKAGFQNGSIQPGNVSELSALAKKAMTDSGGVSVFEEGIPTTLTRKEKQEKVIKEVGLEKLIQLQAMTPAEQLKEIHKLEKTSPYIREVLTQVQQDTAPANMKKLAELSPSEQAVELEKSPYLQALNDSSTVGMLASQQILQNATGVEGMLMQSVMRQGQIRSVGAKKEATSPKKLTIQQKEKQVIKTVGLKQLKELEMMHPLDQKKKLEQLEKKAPHVKEVFKHIQKENSPKVQRDLAALSHSKAKLEKELKKYPYLYENYKNPEIARSVYETEAKKQQQDGLAAVSFVADMVPVVSNVKGGWEASVGYDPITGNELSSFDRSISGAGIVFGGFARVPGKVVKYGSEGAEYVLRVNKAEKTVTKHKVKDVSKGESKAVEKVEKPGGKADVEGVHDQAAVSKGTAKDITFKQGYDKHLIEVEDIVRKKNKGIVGGHNMENFENAFIENGWDLQSCIISKRQHSTIEGIYEIEYGLPALNREGNIIPGELKKVRTPKTVYDPKIISDEQILKWGEEAMKNGEIVGRKITGISKNGVKFEGYIDETTGKITNFFPTLND
ncbi:T7SS effector LXG polymorphic toxin [Priestia aryabhattai]|uniref:T7SS effector LXG polymorphic toxin n=1 Tax=Priestia aryabhattai TaxID=412384 RepID=UPI001C8DA416|nr:T7SS effector LXG polymorphic toxin [Priestia aryabhattai]MBX9967085.1 EndoU domain-containing protein [Priestia aryabhattai]